MLLRLAAAAAILSLCAASAQTATSVPRSPVAIENINAAVVPTGVDIPQANAARPTVTIPAHIPPAGFLQFEQGYPVSDASSSAKPSPSPTPSSPVTFKQRLPSIVELSHFTQPLEATTATGLPIARPTPTSSAPASSSPLHDQGQQPTTHPDQVR